MADDDSQESRYSKEDVSEMVNQAVRERVNEQNRSHQAEIVKLHESYKAPVEPVKVYSRAELNQAVTSKRITEQDAQDIFDKQQDDKIDQKATVIATRAVENNDFARTTQSSIDKYMAHDPDLSVVDSDSHKRVSQEIQDQMKNLGVKTPTLGIELNACRQIYGREDALGGNEHDRQTHQDRFTTDDPVNDETDKGKPEGLSKREADYYQKGIDSGRYTGWEAVTKELEHSDPNVRRRAEARG